MAPTVTQARCAGGVLSAPTLCSRRPTASPTPSTRPGRTSPAQSVMVTATLDAAGVAWPDELPAGWTRDSDTTATLVVTFEDVPCTPVVPVAPTVTSATCAGGAVIGPVDRPADDDRGVLRARPGGPRRRRHRRRRDGDGDAGRRVPLGHGHGTVDVGERDDGHVDRDVDRGHRAPRSRRSRPTVTQAVCAGGVLSPPTLALATTDRITYTVAPSGPYAPGGTATVTATLAGTGVAWPDALPPGWARVNDTTATYAVTFKVVACTPVAPAAPTVTQATCTSWRGVRSDPSRLPDTPGVVYVLDPPDLGDGTLRSRGHGDGDTARRVQLGSDARRLERVSTRRWRRSRSSSSALRAPGDTGGAGGEAGGVRRRRCVGAHAGAGRHHRHDLRRRPAGPVPRRAVGDGHGDARPDRRGVAGDVAARAGRARRTPWRP